MSQPSTPPSVYQLRVVSSWRGHSGQAPRHFFVNEGLERIASGLDLACDLQERRHQLRRGQIEQRCGLAQVAPQQGVKFRFGSPHSVIAHGVPRVVQARLRRLSAVGSRRTLPPVPGSWRPTEPGRGRFSTPARASSRNRSTPWYPRWLATESAARPTNHRVSHTAFVAQSPCFLGATPLSVAARTNCTLGSQ